MTVCPRRAQAQPARAIARRVLAVIVAICAATSPVLAQAPTPGSQPPAHPSDQPPQFEETVDVVSATPVQGLGIDRRKVPSNIQSATSAELARTPAIHFGDQLAATFASVNVNEAQSNPFQPDIQFRGFTVSPLLGLPQGVAVYQDGVRVNEPFGDTLNWDLVPTNAIAGVNLMPGSNPLFGLNALGGAMSVQTKTGFSHPGYALSLWGGSFGRGWADVQAAAHSDRFSYFVTGRLLTENGWRDFSPSDVRQLFANAEWRQGRTTINTSFSGGFNRLIGNGPAPIQLLEQDANAVFTHPDETKGNAGLFSTRVRHTVSPAVSFDAVAYYRPATVRTFNGDDTTYDECESGAFDGFLCDDDGDGDPVRDQNGSYIAANDDDPLSGTNNTSKTRTHGWGGSAQATITHPFADRENYFVTGATLDGGHSGYDSDTELARLTNDRGTAGSGLYDAEAAVRLKTRVQHVGAYVSDFFTPAPRLTLMGAARFNHSSVVLRDQLGDDLTGDHAFTRLNPSAGATFQLPRGVTTYGSISISSRTPTPSELSCADPEDPCRLPNAFLSDPPLKQVVAQTLEGGARATSSGITWAAAAFRTLNRDDILFVSSGALTNAGHFENIGNTLRRGIELSASGKAARAAQWSAAYTYLRATFDTPLTLSSPNHPDEENGEIQVARGARIPGLPAHNFKANLTVPFGRAIVGGTFMTASSQYFRGDEANLLEPIDGYAVTHVSGSYAVHPRARVVGRVTNLFNTSFQTFGALGEADDVLGDDFEDPRFVGPAAPRAAWIGLEISFR